MDLRNGFDIKRYIRNIPDYPKPGIMFRDITTLLSDMHGFRAAVDVIGVDTSVQAVGAALQLHIH